MDVARKSESCFSQPAFRRPPAVGGQYLGSDRNADHCYWSRATRSGDLLLKTMAVDQRSTHFVWLHGQFLVEAVPVSSSDDAVGYQRCITRPGKELSHHVNNAMLGKAPTHSRAVNAAKQPGWRNRQVMTCNSLGRESSRSHGICRHWIHPPTYAVGSRLPGIYALHGTCVSGFWHHSSAVADPQNCVQLRLDLVTTFRLLSTFCRCVDFRVCCSSLLAGSSRLFHGPSSTRMIAEIDERFRDSHGNHSGHSDSAYERKRTTRNRRDTEAILLG